MSLAIQNGTPINIPAPLTPETIGAAFRSSNSLGIPFTDQRPFDRWCWAACTRMVLRVFGQNVRMCRVAEFLLDNPNCCNGDGDACNQDCEVDDILTIFNHFGVDATRVDERVSFRRIREQIDDFGMPVEVQISWQPGGHVLVIDGWSRTNQLRYVHVKDPWYGPGEVRLTDLIDDYTADTGKWVGTWIEFRGI